MNLGAPPLRFLALVVGGWIGLRAAILVPGWWVEAGAAATPQARRAAVRVPAAAAAGAGQTASRRPLQGAILGHSRSNRLAFAPEAPSSDVETTPTLPLLQPLALPPALALGRPTVAEAPEWRIAPSRPRLIAPSRWTGSAWLLLRREEDAGLAPGGTLGGSQAGARLAWRVAGAPEHVLSLSGRLYAPVARPSGAEASLGLDWRPSAALPVHLMVERRQALGREGRSAFAVAAYGGVSGRRLPAGLRLDAFGQAGVVGARSRDLFADGTARITTPAGRFDVGAGLWGGAQPGASRLDAGPHVSMRLPLAGDTVRFSAEWRFRIAGDARPGSGPALSIGTDF
jgi:hypothetical protein